MERVLRIKTENGRIIPINESQLEDYLKIEGTVLLKDEDIVAASIIKPPSSVVNLICPICGKEFKNRGLLAIHKEKEHDLKNSST